MSYKVIYIMADRRSGSTLLENILSKSPETVSVGELEMLKGHILKEGPGDKWNWTCSCGRDVKQCTFWMPVLEKMHYTNGNSFDTNIKWNFKSKKLFLTALLPALFKSSLQKLYRSKKNENIVNTVCDLYKHIFETSGKEVIIDSSKDPVQALALYNNSKNIDIKIIWLKRDIRAIATSKNKWKSINNKKQKALLNRIYDVFYYKRICSAVSKLIPSSHLVEISYEDLAQDTQTQLDKIISKFHLKKYAAPEFMELENDHTIGGTPERFNKKPIAYDASWKQLYNNKKLLYFTGGILNKI